MHTKKSNLKFAAISFFCLTNLCAQAKLITEIIKVPVKVENAYGKTTEQDIVVTTFYDDVIAKASGKPLPIAIINHGRAAKPEERAALGRATNITNARWLAGW